MTAHTSRSENASYDTMRVTPVLLSLFIVLLLLLLLLVVVVVVVFLGVGPVRPVPEELLFASCQSANHISNSMVDIIIYLYQQ